MTQKQSGLIFPSQVLSNRSIVLIGAVGLILCITLTAGLGLMYLRKQVERQAGLSAQTLAGSLQQTFDSLVNVSDVALQASSDEISRQISAGTLDSDAVNLYLVRTQERIAHIAFIRASNEHGDVIYGKDVLKTPINNSDRDYFIYLRDHPHAGLFISKPVISRISKKWIWIFARRINKPDGSFGGAVWAIMNVDEIQNILKQVRIGESGSIALRDAELGLIARNADQNAKKISIGSKTLSTPFKIALQNNPNEGTYVSGATSIDQISRIHSYQRSPQYGYTINVGIPVDNVLAEWRKQVWLISSIVLAFALLVIAYARFVSRTWQRQAIDAEELRVAATAFESQEGMMVTDANSVILRVNHAFTKITGYSSDEAIGQVPQLLSSGKQSKEFYADMWKDINDTGAWEGEIWNRRKSGEIYPEHLTITVVKNSAGIITNYVATFTDITTSKAASDEIKNLAFYDPLTQLPNRRLLIDRLNHALAASARSGERGALVFLDLDHFKTLNDTLGHDVGDLLLQLVAGRLSAVVREGDTVARIGGDEFVVLLEGLSEHNIEAAAQTEDVAE